MALASAVVGAAASEAAKRTPGEARQRAAEDIASLRRLLGESAPKARVARLVEMFATADESPLASSFRREERGGKPTYVAEGATFEFRMLGRTRFRVSDADVLLEPSADGTALRFDLQGTALGASGRIRASGTVNWGASSGGGDRVQFEFALDDASVEELRAAFPERFDPSFEGTMSVSGSAKGAIGETTTEDSPAAPLDGSFVATIDWHLFGTRAPLTVQSRFSLDDRSLRLFGGNLEWRGLSLALKGFVEPRETGRFRLTATCENLEVAPIARAWGVPDAWAPRTAVSGRLDFYGKPGESFIAHDLGSGPFELPAMGGHPVRWDSSKITGRLAAINAEASALVRPKGLRVADYALGELPLGLSWWKGVFKLHAANTTIWNGDIDSTLTYDPARHPALRFHGRVDGADAKLALEALLPASGVDGDGVFSLSILRGQDSAAEGYLSLRARLRRGRFGETDLFAATLAALGAGSAALAVADPSAASPKPTTMAPQGTAVDVGDVHLRRTAEGLSVGPVTLAAGDFALDADGSATAAGNVDLAGTVKLSAALAAELRAKTPWASALLAEDGAWYVPVRIRGPLARVSVELAPGYDDVLARAGEGAAVTAPARHVPRSYADAELSPFASDRLAQ